MQTSCSSVAMTLKLITFVTFLMLLCTYMVTSEKPCAQHTVKLNYLRNCHGQNVDNQIIQLKNVTFMLASDCKFVPRGCYSIKKTITDAKSSYYISKPPFKKNSTEDICKGLDDPDFQKKASSYKNIDKKCPLKAGDYCIKSGSTLFEKLNPSALNMAVGTIKGIFNINANKGSGKACIEMEMVVSKKK